MFELAHSPTSKGVYATVGVIGFFSTVAVGIRLKIRRSAKAGFGLDDLAVFFTLLMGWTLGIIMVVLASQDVIGTHSSYNPATGKSIDTPKLDMASRFLNIYNVLVIVADGVLKLTFLLFFKRIFVGRIFKWTTNIMLVVVILWTLAFFFATLTQCQGHLIPDPDTSANIAKYCIPAPDIRFAHALTDVVTDLFIISIPLPILWNLHSSRAIKFGLFFTFILGMISVAAGSVRLYFIVVNIWETTVGARDFQGDATNVMTWGYIEVGIGIIAACLVTFRPLVTSRTAESIVNSVRSVISNQSMRSSGSSGTRTTKHGRTSQEQELRTTHKDTETVDSEHGLSQSSISRSEEKYAHDESSIENGQGIIVRTQISIDSNART